MSKKNRNADRSPNRDWTQVLTIVGANITLILVMFGTTVGMWMHTDNKLEANHKETAAQLRAIQDEMKDFHGRLCAIEERGRERK
jgi:hypothetical protein